MYSPMTASLVGRIASGSVSSLPPPCVTTASSGLNPSTCSASRSKKFIGISSGKYAFCAPAALMRVSTARCIRSHRPHAVESAPPYGCPLLLTSAWHAAYPPSLKAGEKRNFLPDLVGQLGGQGLD